MIRVVNKYKHKPTVDDVYCGRGSLVGNPYSHLPSSKAEFKVGSREEAINKYIGWLDIAICNDPAVHTFIDVLIDREIRGKDTNLVCYCSPQPCHCDIIKSMIDEDVRKVRKMYDGTVSRQVHCHRCGWNGMEDETKHPEGIWCPRCPTHIDDHASLSVGWET